jgi:prohibitin 2
MDQDPREAIRKLQQQIQQRTRGSFGGRGGFPGGAPILPIVAIGVLLGGGFIVSNSIFNGRAILEQSCNWNVLTLLTVDGGHRAIKYTRIGGVKQEIYNEG